MSIKQTFKEYLIEQASKVELNDIGCDKLDGKQKEECEKCKTEEDKVDFLRKANVANN